MRLAGLGTLRPSFTQLWMELLDVSRTGPPLPAPAGGENHHELGESEIRGMEPLYRRTVLFDTPGVLSSALAVE